MMGHRVPKSLAISRNFSRGDHSGLLQRAGPSGPQRPLYVLLARATALFLFSWVVSGCSLTDTDATRGLNPTLDAADVSRASYNTGAVLSALASDSGVGISSPGSWYEITVAGFNYVDDQCTAYFDKLFFLDRDREATKAALGAFGQTTNAILGVTGASALSIAVVAQAFGLASSVTDIVAGSYLYQLPPATTLSFVKTMQAAFRAGASEQKSQINGPATAYHIIQSYLSLCLPPTIEARLISHIADASATPVANGSGAGISLLIGSRNQVAPSTPITLISSSRQPLPKLVQRETNVRMAQATSLFPASDLASIQQALCVHPSDGQLGDPGSSTRQAIIDFVRGLDGRDIRSFDTTGAGLSPKEISKLHEAADKGTCEKNGFHNAFEVGQSVS